MRTYEGARSARTLARIFEDAIALLVQDASEYAFTGLLGGAAACFAAIILRFIDNDASNALVAPATIIIAALTLSTTTAAMCRAAENLQPDAGRAFASVLLRPMAYLRPWLGIALALFAAAYAIESFSLPDWLRTACIIAVTGGAIAAALPSSFHAIALVTQRGTAQEAAAAGSALARRSMAPLAAAWCVVMTPALLATLLGLGTGFGRASSGVWALVFVASMPVAAAVMALMFIEAAERLQVSSQGPPKEMVRQRAQRAVRGSR
jgi:hypothetical protein